MKEIDPYTQEVYDRLQALPDPLDRPLATLMRIAKEVAREWQAKCPEKLEEFANLHRQKVRRG